MKNIFFWIFSNYSIIRKKISMNYVSWRRKAWIAEQIYLWIEKWLEVAQSICSCSRSCDGVAIAVQ